MARTKQQDEPGGFRPIEVDIRPNDRFRPIEVGSAPAPADAQPKKPTAGEK